MAFFRIKTLYWRKVSYKNDNLDPQEQTELEELASVSLFPVWP